MVFSGANWRIFSMLYCTRSHSFCQAVHFSAVFSAWAKKPEKYGNARLSAGFPPFKVEYLPCAFSSAGEL
jgi:hypothetical protein